MSGDQKESEKAPILVYYSFRGRAQAIRNLLCYLQVRFYEYHIDDNEHNLTLPSEVVAEVKETKIEKQQLPALIHSGFVVYNQETVMVYLCKLYKHAQLLGSNIFVRARLQELVSSYIPQLRVLNRIYDFAVKSLTHSEAQTDAQGHSILQSLFSQVKYLTYYCQHLVRQAQQKFILGQLTFLDFIFMESCEYMLGYFGKPERIRRDCQVDLKECETCQNYKIRIYMEVIKKYSSWMNGQAFYLKNHAYLESYSTKMSWMSVDKVQGVKKVWMGNPKLVA